MKHPRFSWALAVAGALGAPAARAQVAVLAAAGDPSQIAEVELAQVMADESSQWLSVKLEGRARLAVAVSSASVEETPGSEAWLRALDFATRVRVVPPLGPLADCAQVGARFADSGLPEPPAITPSQVREVSSELELRRSFEDAGLSVDLAQVVDFGKAALPPFRFSVYEAGASGGNTSALRLVDHGRTGILPQITAAGRDSVPLTLLALAAGAVTPEVGSVADPSELPVTYFGASATTDYAAARSSWLAGASGRWLTEARDSSALFAWSVFPDNGSIAPAVSRYFAAAPGVSSAAACVARVQAARAQSSHAAADYSCDGSDDLARSLSELAFGDVRLTRLFGSVTPAGAAFHVADGAPQDAPLVATDFDATGCKMAVSGLSSGGVAAPGGGVTDPRGAVSPDPGYASGDSTDPASQESTSTEDSGSCDVSIFSGDSCSGDSSSSDSSSNDSCSGDSSSSDSSSNDSCSGDSSSSDSSSNDSCSGDSSSSDSSSNDSCSGDSSSSSDKSSDSSGCGNSGYDGDTCSGSSAPSGASDSDGKASAALDPASRATSQRHPRRVRLSLLTLLAAAIVLPLRRRSHVRASLGA